MANFEVSIILAEVSFFWLTEDNTTKCPKSHQMVHFYLGFQAKNILNIRNVPTK